MNQFIDDIPLMINRACRMNGYTQKELGEQLGYNASNMSLLASGNKTKILGMPIHKLAVLLELSNSSYSWERK